MSDPTARRDAFNKAFDAYRDIQDTRKIAVTAVEQANQWAATNPESSEAETAARITREAEDMAYTSLLTGQDLYHGITTALQEDDHPDMEAITKQLNKLLEHKNLVRMWTEVASHASRVTITEATARSWIGVLR